MAGAFERAAVILQLVLHPNLAFLLKNGFRFIWKNPFYPLLLIFAPDGHYFWHTTITNYL